MNPEEDSHQMDNDSLSSVGHDLKSPLTGITMMIHLLLEKKVGPLNVQQEMMLTSVKEDVDKLIQAIEKHCG
ncbi:MAG: histidine kinase dimerization/phospho-acceptor domain-containing protein [Akkermansiaceae bacterium]